VAQVIELPVFKIYCAEDPGAVTGSDVLFGDIPAGCELGEGVAYSVAINGTPVEDPTGLFITDETGSFSLPVAPGDGAVITEDLTTILPGYEPLLNPVELFDASAESDPPLFINVATGDPVGEVIEIPVFKIYCATDPGDVNGTDVLFGDVPLGCTLGEGVAYDVEINGEPINESFVTDESGSFSLSVETSDDVVITENLESVQTGYEPVNNSITLDDANAESDPPLFINLLTNPDGEVEILKRVCSVEVDRDTDFSVIYPGDDDTELGNRCQVGSGVAFTINGDTLEIALHRSTGEDGWFTVNLPVGDYTLTEISTGASVAFSVGRDETTTITVVNYEKVRELPNTGLGERKSQDPRFGFLMLIALIGLGVTLHSVRRSNVTGRTRG